jgi:Family of unknown function (DUF6174)
MASKVVGNGNTSTKLLTNRVNGYLMDGDRGLTDAVLQADPSMEPFMLFSRCRLTILAVSFSSAVVGCGRLTPTETAGVALDLARAEQKWQKAGLTNYSFESGVSCYCPLIYVGPHVVTVRSGVVTSITNKATGEAVPLTYRFPMDSVFAFVRREQATRPQNLTVTFDAQLGFPRSIKYGTPENDAGGFITIDNVRAMTP